MGCDIHMFVERRESAESPWHLAELEPWACDWCKGTGKRNAGDEAACYWCGGGKVANRFDQRNYDLFGMLANVRNGSGFAGVSTGDGYEPISEPRGWPADMSAELKEHLRRVEEDNDDESYYDACRKGKAPGLALTWPGDHSETWLSLAEVLAYFEKGSRSSMHEGFVELAHMPVVFQHGAPQEWCGGVEGQLVAKVDMQTAKKLIENPPTDGRHYFVHCTWTSTYAKDAGAAFMDRFIPACMKLGPPDNVRLVFNFDS